MARKSAQDDLKAGGGTLHVKVNIVIGGLFYNMLNPEIPPLKIKIKRDDGLAPGDSQI